MWSARANVDISEIDIVLFSNGQLTDRCVICRAMWFHSNHHRFLANVNALSSVCL